MQNRFQAIICDADTAVFNSAKLLQEEYVEVTLSGEKEVREFNNKTAFWGGWKKKDGGWLAILNEARLTQELPPILAEDCQLEECVRLKDGIDDYIDEGLKIFASYIKKIKGTGFASKYVLAIGGKGNYRHEAAHIRKYKGERKEKPLLFAEVREAIINQYKNSIVICDGIEADDYLGIKGTESYKHFKETGTWKYLLCYIDKDIRMVVCPNINPDYLEKGIHFQTPAEAARCFAVQCLAGDKSTDNIPGLPTITPDIREKYGIRKGAGLGLQTAINFLAECETPKAMFERVVEAYKGYYGTEIHKFESWRGEEMEYEWLDYLQENATLLWMQRKEGQMVNMGSFLKSMGIEL